MLVKSKAVILHQIKYSDSGVVVHAYTREMGRQSLIVKGMRSRKSGKHNVLLQALSVLELEYYHKESRSVDLLKEFNVSYLPADIYSDVRKSSIAVFLGEVLTSVLREETPNHDLFSFIEDSIKYLDSSKTGFNNFHLSFLIGLCSYLGFEPGARNSPSDKYFDMLNGSFVPYLPGHQDYAGTEISGILASFLSGSFEKAGDIPLTGKLRNEALDTILKYYSIHLPGLKKINSLEVLKEIFG